MEELAEGDRVRVKDSGWTNLGFVTVIDKEKDRVKVNVDRGHYGMVRKWFKTSEVERVQL